MAHINKNESSRIKHFIDASGIKHRELACSIGMTDWNFCDRYTGRVRWKTEELRELGPLIGCSLLDLIE